MASKSQNYELVQVQASVSIICTSGIGIFPTQASYSAVGQTSAIWWAGGDANNLFHSAGVQSLGGIPEVWNNDDNINNNNNGHRNTESRYHARLSAQNFLKYPITWGEQYYLAHLETQKWVFIFLIHSL